MFTEDLENKTFKELEAEFNKYDDDLLIEYFSLNSVERWELINLYHKQKFTTSDIKLKARKLLERYSIDINEKGLIDFN